MSSSTDKPGPGPGPGPSDRDKALAANLARQAQTGEGRHNSRRDFRGGMIRCFDDGYLRAMREEILEGIQLPIPTVHRLVFNIVVVGRKPEECTAVGESIRYEHTPDYWRSCCLHGFAKIYDPATKGVQWLFEHKGGISSGNCASFPVACHWMFELVGWRNPATGNVEAFWQRIE